MGQGVQSVFTTSSLLVFSREVSFAKATDVAIQRGKLKPSYVNSFSETSDAKWVILGGCWVQILVLWVVFF